MNEVSFSLPRFRNTRRRVASMSDVLAAAEREREIEGVTRKTKETSNEGSHILKGGDSKHRFQKVA